MIYEIQNNLQNSLFYDQKQVGDRQKQVPFHVVMKTLNMLCGQEGYLDSLLSIIDDDLLVLYRNKELKHFKSPLKKPEYVHKFTDIGQLAIEYGQDEIQHFDIQTADETLVNKLIVAKLYTKLIEDSLNFFTKLQETISIVFDEIYEGKHHSTEVD